MIDVRPTAQELKDEIDDLRRQWDYLGNEGSQSEKQRLISSQIERVQAKLKSFYGEEHCSSAVSSSRS